jgi:hypothetical protein
MIYTSVTNPVWVDSTRKMISVYVVFPDIGDKPVQFNACSTDIEQHGRVMFAELMTGQYGPISEPKAE